MPKEDPFILEFTVSRPMNDFTIWSRGMSFSYPELGIKLILIKDTKMKMYTKFRKTQKIQVMPLTDNIYAQEDVTAILDKYFPK